MNPTRRWFVKAFSGAILTTLLGVKAWRLEASESAIGDVSVGIGGLDSEASGLPPGITLEWSRVPWSLTRGGEVYARGVGMVPHGDGFILHGPDGDADWSGNET